jgi:hypothetical protein
MSVESVAWGGTQLEWFKSSYSSSEVDSDCVEIAAAPGTVHVRDSKDKEAAQLAFTAGPWADFLAYVSGC